MMALETGTILQARYRYRLVRRLGHGGFGSVYQAHCLDREAGGREDTPPQEVAIKVLGSSRHADAMTTMKRELAALRRVRHSRIPALYDGSLEGEVAFVVMAYYPAGSLADARPWIGRLDVDQTWRLVGDLLSALSAAHRASVLHLDVKPSNVLLDGHGGFVLTDFGVAHTSLMSKGLLIQGQIPIGLGTHGYGAPEQTDPRTRAFDLRTDLWGVGATAWAAFTGVDLHQRKEVLRRAEDGSLYGLPTLSEMRADCPPPLEEVVMGLLFLDPERRPGGAAEVLTRIKAIAARYGMDSQPAIAATRSELDPAEVHRMIASLVDPLWAATCRTPGFDRYFARFEDGDVIAAPGDSSHHTHLLLRGRILIERDGEAVDVEKEEGAFLGMICTLTGAARKVTLRARGTVWVCVFNEAELEQFASGNPAVAVRMLRGMASRIAGGPKRHQD